MLRNGKAIARQARTSVAQGDAMTVVVLLALIIAVIVLGVWGASTAATGLTIATANLASQTVALLLSCVVIAMLPLAIYGAIRLGVQLKECQRQHDITEQGATPIQIGAPRPRMLNDDRFILLRLPESAQPQSQRIVRQTRRSARSMRQATRLTRRWFT